MRLFKTIFITTALTLGAFAVTTSLQSCSKKDKCNIVCKNGGECVDGVCQCPVGFEGKDCGTYTRAKYKGMFNAIDNCVTTDRNNASLNYTIFILNGPVDEPTKVLVRGLGNQDGGNVELTGHVNGSTLTIDNQTVGGKEYSGKIEYISQTDLKGSFNIKDGNETIESCFSAMARS